MQRIRTKRVEEILKYDYPVCEIVECERESEKLAITETKMVDFCEYHYKKLILEEE